MKMKKQEQDTFGKAAGACRKSRRSAGGEKGMALVLVLILSAVALATMAALVYMLTARTQTSGGQKRYSNAVAAGRAGTDVAFDVIANRGVLSLPGINFSIPITGSPPNNLCLDRKLDYGTFNPDGTFNWVVSGSNCDNSSYIDPATQSSYDWSFQLGDAGGGQSYTVYGKIVNTVEGNSAPSKGLTKGNGVAATDNGEITVVSRPYLYTMEVDAEQGGDRPEKARYSVLYEY